MLAVSPQRMNLSAPVPAASSAADDTSLIARYVAGDDRAFASLLARYQGRVFTLVRLIVRDAALAEDLTQDTFVKAVQLLRAGRYHDEGKFGSWVCRIAHNLAIDVLRRTNRQPTVSLDAPLPSGMLRLARVTSPDAEVAASPEAVTIQAERKDFLRLLIQNLPVDQRQVLLMRHYGEMTFAEIASLLDIPLNTALGRMRYALRGIRRQLQASSGGTSLLLSLLVATVGTLEMATTVTATGTLATHCFSSSFPQTYSDDPTFYPGNADPLRLQRPA